MTYVIGLTGSIGMGKTTTAQMFADEGVHVWDADACVHKLYSPGGAAVTPIHKMAPSAILKGSVSRDALRDLISKNPTLLDQVNAAVHPLVQADRQAFLDQHQNALVLLDVPLLFETGADQLCDFIVVVSAPPDVQKARVLGRGEMTEADLQMILSRQMPDSEKRQKADQVILTETLADTRKTVKNLVVNLKKQMANA
jgi:dephospho-CoA kinase